MRFSDNGNGTFTNPLLQGDYPDPDIIRVGNDFYLVSSSFTCAPGIPICHSQDLINWRIIGHAYDRLPEANPAYSMQNGMTAYRGGSWAPFIRHHQGHFYIGFCTPAEGFFMCISSQPEGPYEIISFALELYDSSLLFDDDGRVYISHGANGLYITELSSDARSILKPPQTIFQSPFGTPLEGSHLYKRKGWYYLCLTCRGYNGIQVVLRSRRIMGPYEWRIISADDMNYAGAGLHQGGFVELASGETWFFLFQDRDYLGRLPVLQPVRWVEDWPELGDPENYGKAYVTARKPTLPTAPFSIPEGPDEFDQPTLAKTWHWNHNPDNTRWSLTQRPGWIRMQSEHAPSFLQARNTLMQKIIGPETTAYTRLDASGLKQGDIAGLAVVNIPYAYIAVHAQGSTDRIITVHYDEENATVTLPKSKEWFFRIQVDATGLAHFAYSPDGENFQPLGEPFILQFTVKTFLGNRWGLFCYQSQSGNAPGYADFDYLHFDAPEPGNFFSAFSVIPAVAYDREHGTDTQRCQEKRPQQRLINLNEGDWVIYDQIDFGTGASHFQVTASPIGSGGRIEIHLHHAAGELLGTCEIPPDGNLHDWSGTFSTYTCAMRTLQGKQTICLSFHGEGLALFRLEHFTFFT